MIPFTEKYRPRKIDDLLLDEIIKIQLELYLKNKKIPNIILTGDTGVGKTITLNWLIRNLYHKEDITNMIFEIKSTEGIDVNKSLITFCKKKVFYREGYATHKLIIIDESDNLLEKTQILISSFFTNYPNISFVLTCNDLSDIIESIQSRSITFSFNRVCKEKIINKMKFICNTESMEYDEEGLEYLYTMSNNDIRKIFNNIETLFYSKKKITIENINTFFSIPSNETFEKLYNSIVNKNIEDITIIIKIFGDEGYYPSDIISYFIFFLINNENINKEYKIKLINLLSVKLFDISALSINNYLQLSSCIYELLEL